jgi:hypothetical protein
MFVYLGFEAIFSNIFKQISYITNKTIDLFTLH